MSLDEGEPLVLEQLVRARLQVMLDQLGLVVKQVLLGWSARHVQVNHPLGLGRKVRRLRAPSARPPQAQQSDLPTLLRVSPDLGGCQPARIAIEQRRQRNGTQSSLRRLQELAAAVCPRELEVQGEFRVHENQPLVKTPSRFRSTFATVVHAASSAELVPAGSGPGAGPDKFAAACESLRIPLEFRIEESDERLDLLGLWTAAKAEMQAKSHPSSDVCSAFAHNSPGERLRGLDVDRIVQGHERLERRIGTHSFDRTDFAARGVEGGHRRIGHCSPPERIEPPAVPVCSLAGRPGALAVECRLPETVRLRREDTRPAELARKQPARGHRLVAHHLGLEPHPRRSRQQAVARIPLPELGSDLRRLR